MGPVENQHSVRRVVEFAAIAPMWLTVLLVPVIRSWPPETSVLSLALIAVATIVLIVAAAKRPLQSLVVLVLMVGLMGYLRVATPLGKDLILAAVAAVGAGASLPLVVRNPGRLRDAAGGLLPWVVGHSIVMGLWAMLALIRYSPRLQPLLAAVQLEGLSWLGVSAVSPLNSLPVYVALASAQAPAMGLLVIAAIWQPHTRCFSRPRAMAFVRVFLAVAAVNLVAGFGQSFIPSFPVVPWRELVLGTTGAPVAGLFHNSNLLALLIILVTPLSLTLLGHSRAGGRLRIVAAGVLGLTCLLLPGIGSRTSDAGIALIATVMAVLLLRCTVPRARSVYMAVAALVLSAGLATSMDASWTPFIRALATQTVPRAGGGEANDGLRAVLNAGSGREDMNRSALLMLRDHPILGVGLGGGAALRPAYYEKYGVIVAPMAHTITSFPLRTLVELGVLGSAVRLGLIIVLCWPVFVAGWTVAARRRDMDLDVGLAVGCATLLLVSVWTGEWATETQFSVLFLTALALVRVWPGFSLAPGLKESR